MVQSLVQAQSLATMDAERKTQEGGELFVPWSDQALAIDPQPRLAVIELLQQAVPLAAPPLVLAHAEDLSHGVGGQTEDSEFSGALKNFVAGKVTPEDELASLLDLLERRRTGQGEGSAILLGEFRA